MYLDLKDIGPNGLSFEGEVVVPDLERYPGERVQTSSARLTVRVVREAESLELQGGLAAELELDCGRCLEPFVFRLETPLGLRLVPEAGADDDGPPSEIPVEEGDETETWSIRDGKLDLERLVAEFVLLNLPLKPVCRDACRGLCPRCGANRNEGECGCAPGALDPRLAPLAEFRKRSGSH